MISEATRKYWIDVLKGWAEDRLAPPQCDECCAVLEELEKTIGQSRLPCRTNAGLRVLVEELKGHMFLTPAELDELFDAEVARIEIMLPWPSLDLSPNARVHWSVKARAAERAKNDAYLLTLEQTHGEQWSAPGEIRVSMRFCPPSHRNYDLDNLLAACKHSLDGIAHALGVDDQRFMLIPSRGWVLPKGGAVQIKIGAET